MNYFSPTDGWLFVSLLYCGKNTALNNIIRKGDMIDHSLFTLEEINEGLSRLANEGFIRISDKIELTDKAKKFEKSNRRFFENFIDKQLRYRKIFQDIALLNKPCYKCFFTEMEYENAIKVALG